MQVAQDWAQWWAFMITVMNRRVPKVLNEIGCGLVSSDLGSDPVAGFCEDNYEPSSYGGS
jgi:hypothetical protein